VENYDYAVSVITPTYGRSYLLPHAYNIFKSQNIENIEWVVVDDSEHECAFMVELSDPRVRYIRVPERMSTGAKRNMAVDAARGRIIAQFDDDDYYAPNYLRTMIDCMSAGSAEFVKLTSFFLYSKIHKAYGYWESMKKDGLHYVWSANPSVEIVKFSVNADTEDMHLGYGFSYVFKKEVWEATGFQDIFFNQDTPFIKSAIANGFKIYLINDNSGICLHVLHGGNASRSFPQYIIPHALIYRFFPNIDPAYLQVDG
jgi:glycosyltransferase involved in cell wall biosynthesis